MPTQLKERYVKLIQILQNISFANTLKKAISDNYGISKLFKVISKYYE